jgi:2-dehydro-3-deoxyphosphooctonate aldolase (KDO 8-P synthase)
MAKVITINDINIGAGHKLAVIAGPCQIESQQHAQDMCGSLQEITRGLGLSLIYKSSFDKANRSSVSTKRGVGIDAGVKILNGIKHQFGVPVITDIHETHQAQVVADAGVDVLQIPAFLCRQTDLLLTAGETGCAINVKKGQFLAPHDMKNVAEKIASTGNQRIMLCERGVTHGYNNLVVDMRSLPIMAETGYPIVYDCTHSVQRPGGLGTVSGGDRSMVPYLSRAAVATGKVNAVFIETHQDPDSAPSDGPNMVPLADLAGLLEQLRDLHALVDGYAQAV